MTVASSLLTDMTPQFAGGDHRVAMPLVPLQMRRGDRLGWRHTALVDSGAAFTLARLSVAARLGLDAAAVRGSPDRVELSPAGPGPSVAAWGWEADLYLGAGPSEDRLLLPAARVYFTEAPLAGFDVLLGHHDAFERLTFSVLNHPPRRRFVLRFPTESKR